MTTQHTFARPAPRSTSSVGRPLLYGTTREFLKKFGFASLKDLPEVPEYEELRREREEQGYGQLSINFDEEEKTEPGADESGEEQKD